MSAQTDVLITTSHMSPGLFMWPLPIDGNITSGFGMRNDPFTGEQRFHGGTDIAAAEGTPILASADGTVIIANAYDPWGGGCGFYVIIDHGGGYSTLYGHCLGICVYGGMSVSRGDIIGYVGSTGNSTGNHLHFEVRYLGARDDPMTYFAE